jgi:hypothetical protein
VHCNHCRTHGRTKRDTDGYTYGCTDARTYGCTYECADR